MGGIAKGHTFFCYYFYHRAKSDWPRKRIIKHIIGCRITLMILMKNNGRKRMTSNIGARKYSASSSVMNVYIDDECIICSGTIPKIPYFSILTDLWYCNIYWKILIERFNLQMYTICAHLIETNRCNGVIVVLLLKKAKRCLPCTKDICLCLFAFKPRWWYLCWILELDSPPSGF